MHTKFLCFDLETEGRDDVVPLLPSPEADKRLTDPAKIAADIERKMKATISALSLNANTCRIVTVGLQSELMDAPEVLVGIPESDMLARLWALSKGRTLIGYRSRTFDLVVAVQRSRFLRVPVPDWRKLTAPWGRSTGHIDLYDEATMDGATKGCDIPQTLTYFCREYGCTVPDDDTSGADVAAMLKTGNLEGVRRHCEIDIRKTVALARALNVIPAAS